MASKGKVLLMDDEQIILDVTHEVLKFLGYEVMFARDGAAAIDLYKAAKSSGSPFDIVILDLSVPEGMGGKEAIAGLKTFDPDVKAVVSSGYSNDPVVQEYERYGFSGKLTKPYKINDMKNILEHLIKK
jgi:CheY-like chemotaxis protein